MEERATSPEESAHEEARAAMRAPRGRGAGPRPAPPRDAPAGTAALSVWFGAIAGLAVVARVALAERGTGLAAGALWVGALAGAAAVAGIVWRAAGRSSLWLHRVL